MRRPTALFLLAGTVVACASTAPVVTPPAPSVTTAPGPTVAPPARTSAPPAPAAPEPTPVATVPAITQAAPAPAPRGPVPTARPTAAGRQIVLNFDNADIEAFIQAASEIVGFNYTIGPGIAGKKVTVQTSGRIPEEEVLNVLLAVLEVNGATAIRSGNLYKIVPITAARERPVPTIIGAQPDPGRRDDEIITQIIPIARVPAERVASVIRPFVQGANVVVYGNLLLVTDTVGNIARLLQIVAVVDVETALDDLRFIQVRYADVQEMAKVLNDFFAGRRVRTPTTTAAPLPVAPRVGVPAVPSPTAVADATERPPLILADKRTNILIVSARRADLDIISQTLAQLDVDTQANKRVFVYYLENVKAKDLAATLGEIFGRPSREGEVAAQRRELPPGTPGAPPPGLPVPVVPVAPLGGPDAEPGVVEGQVKFVADETNNALIATTFARNWPLIEDTIRKLDRTPKQVLIEVLVAEITLDDDNRYGLEWTLRTQRNVKVGDQTYNVGTVGRLDVGPTGPGLPGGVPILPGLPVPVPPLAGLSLFIFETDRFLSLLNLYANYGKLTVLSSPHILTSENKKAVINVSSSIPIVTGQTVSQTGTVATQPQQPPSSVLNQTVEYRDAGIILTVTPRISDKRVVALDVKQAVNDVGPPQPPSGSPIIIKREAETNVVLHDNQTLILGGLIQTRLADQRTGIPLLSRIPFLGFLFGATTESVRRTELLILITPRVIGDPAEARELLQQIRSQRPDLVRELRKQPTILRPDPTRPLPEPAPQTRPEPPPVGGATYER